MASDCTLYSSLYNASQYRDGNLEELFSHENHACPVSLSEYGTLSKTDKSDLLKCLSDVHAPSFDYRLSFCRRCCCFS